MKQTLAILAIATITGCTSGQTQGTIPSQIGTNPISTNTLNFAVGTATFSSAAGAIASTGLNVVATFRQNANGNTAVLFNTPTITAPAGFVVPATADAGTDAGTNAITGIPTTDFTVVNPATTFGNSTGVFGYGLGPNNAANTGTTSFSRVAQPYYVAAASKVRYTGGPPLFPTQRDGTFPAGDLGFSTGFTTFAAAPVAGPYNLTLVVPTGFDSTGKQLNGSVAAGSALAAAVPAIGAFARPVLTLDGAGGGAIAYVLPIGATEGIIEVALYFGKCYPSPGFSATGPAAYYTLRVDATTPNPIALPDTLGPTSPNQKSTPTICPGNAAGSATYNAANGTAGGDSYQVYGAAFDYPALEAAYPFSNAVKPAIAGANGQADVSLSSVPPTTVAP